MNADRKIENLLYRYAELIDNGDFEAVARLFEHGAIVAPDGSRRSGYEDVLAMYREATRIYPDSGTPCTQHITSNLQINADESAGRATVRSCFTVLQALPDFPLQPIISGRYEDELDCVDGNWRFRTRVMLPTLFGDISRHLLFDASRIK